MKFSVGKPYFGPTLDPNPQGGSGEQKPICCCVSSNGVASVSYLSILFCSSLSKGTRPKGEKHRTGEARRKKLEGMLRRGRHCVASVHGDRVYQDAVAVALSHPWLMRPFMWQSEPRSAISLGCSSTQTVQ